MKCPFALEPHQIQGLDFINIFPVIQWLVKESVNLRSKKAERLKLFSVGQFHNHFDLTTGESDRVERIEVLRRVKEIQGLYAAKRQLRELNDEPEGENSQVRLALLDYGIRKFGAKSSSIDSDEEDDEVSSAIHLLAIRFSILFPRKDHRRRVHEGTLCNRSRSKSFHSQKHFKI